MRFAGAQVDQAYEDLDRGWPLRFPQPLERSYREEHYRDWLATRRLSLLIGLIAYAAFTAADLWAAPDDLAQVLLFRALGCAAIATALALSFTRWFQRVSELVLALAVVIAGGAIAGMEIAMRPADPGYELYLFGIAIAVFYGFTATGLTFWHATLACSSVLVLGFAVLFAHHPEHDMVHMFLLEGLVLGAFAIGMTACFFIDTGGRHRFLQERRLDRERERSEGLLLNILPAPVAARLKRGESVADRVEDVTVLFADLVNFTAMSRSMDPAEVVAFLDHLFTRFDRSARIHGLEKVKTIGDSYMAVAGLPEPTSRPAHQAARLALDMLAIVLDERTLWDLDVRLRVGLHSGPVIAGVIGVDKFSYDLWGDTVNTASRMESCGRPDCVQVSDVTREQLGSDFTFEGPNAVEVKGKGVMTTYFLVGEAGRRSQAEVREPGAVGRAII